MACSAKNQQNSCSPPKPLSDHSGVRKTHIAWRDKRHQVEAQQDSGERKVYPKPFFHSSKSKISAEIWRERVVDAPQALVCFMFNAFLGHLGDWILDFSWISASFEAHESCCPLGPQSMEAIYDVFSSMFDKKMKEVAYGWLSSKRDITVRPVSLISIRAYFTTWKKLNECAKKRNDYIQSQELREAVALHGDEGFYDDYIAQAHRVGVPKFWGDYMECLSHGVHSIDSLSGRHFAACYRQRFDSATALRTGAEPHSSAERLRKPSHACTIHCIVR